jgi:MFS family permease/quinol monooxygenase YgiN
VSRKSEEEGEVSTSAWAPLRNRVFLALFIAQIASNIGTMMHGVGAIWLMGDLNSSPTLVALVQTATFLPVFLVGVPAGALADIFDRRLLLIVTQLFMFATALALALMTFADRVSEPQLLGLTFLLGLFGALNMPAWHAIQPELVKPGELPQALALGNTTFNVGRAIGPAFGGLVVARGGPEWVFLLNAISFLAVVAVLLRWRQRKATSTLPPETIGGATRAGLRYGMNSPALRRVLVRSVSFMLPAVALLSLLPVVARGPLGLGSGGFGVLLGCFGFGAAASAVVRPRIVARVSVDRLMLLATGAIGIALVLIGLSDSSIVTGITLVLAGAAWTLAITATGVAAQAALPSWVRARGMGLWNIAITGSVAIGSTLWGAVASWDLTGAHVVAAVALVAMFLMTLRWKLSAIDRLDLQLASLDDPVVTLTPRPTDGPVLVTIRYRVEPAQYADFIADMRRVERQRRRTGAHRWGLFRDLADPDVVVENFLVESWAEHVRQHHRTTNSDLEVLGTARRHVTADLEIGHFVSCYASDGEPATVDATTGTVDPDRPLREGSAHGVPPDPS